MDLRGYRCRRRSPAGTDEFQHPGESYARARFEIGSPNSRWKPPPEANVLLLTGATGQAGSHIVHEFIEQGVQVRLLVRNRTLSKQLEGIAGIEIVEGDMTDSRGLVHSLRGVERVLMISSSSLDMVVTQCAFIDACKAAGVQHVIKFSGLDARPETTFPFGQMHKQVETYLEKSGLAWTHLRPTGFMQEYLREVPSILSNSAIYLAIGETRLNPVDLLDVGKVGFRLLRDGGFEGARLAMTGPELLSMADIAGEISRATGKEVRYVPIPPEARRQALIAHGIPEVIADALDKQVSERIKGGLESQIDLSTHEIFDVEPTKFSQFAQRYAGSFGRM